MQWRNASIAVLRRMPSPTSRLVMLDLRKGPKLDVSILPEWDITKLLPQH